MSSMTENISIVIRFALNALLLLTLPVIVLASVLYNLGSWLLKSKQLKVIRNEISVVTGGAQGLGKYIAIQLASNGSHVAIVDINEVEALRTAEFIASKYKVMTKAYKIDITNYDDVQRLHENVCKDLGPPTILINNAGMLLIPNSLQPQWQDVQRMIDVNFTSHFWTHQVFLPKMKELNRGHIVCVSSISAVVPTIFNAPYASTKCAARALMNILRLELKYEKLFNIHTTNAMPYFLNTNMEVKKLYEPTMANRLLPMISGERAAQEIVEAMLLNKTEIFVGDISSLQMWLHGFLPTDWIDLVFIYLAKISNNFLTIR